MALGGILAAAVLATMSLQAQQRPAAFQRGRDLFLANQVGAAVLAFQEAALASPRDAAINGWLAEALRRGERLDEAASAARSALAEDSCQVVALTALGMAYSSQYSSWPDAHPDSAWRYLRRAVTCDPRDGNAWIPLWPHVLARGDTALERELFVNLAQGGFLTRAALAYADWILAGLPDSAVVLMNGDLDTYPARALQEARRVRRDVAVVNLPMLNLTWYAAHVRDRYGLPLPGSEREMQQREMCDTFGAGTTCRVDAIVAHWRTEFAAGRARRPVTALFDDVFPKGPGTVGFAGPVFIAGGDSAWSAPSRRWAALARAQAPDFAGPGASPDDRSPVRRTGNASRSLARSVMWKVAAHGVMEAQAGRRKEALEALAWAERFAAAIELPAALSADILQYLRDGLKE